MATATRSNGDIGGMCKAPVRFQQLFFNQSSQNEGEVENVRVVVRLRPLSESEIKAGFRQIVRVDSVSNTISVENPNGANGEPPKSFTYDMVFNTEISQLDVYNEIARPIVNKVLMGYNGTILAYGQTGTGKTYTMEGICSSPELKGIIPNSFAHIFGHIAKATENTKFLVRVSHIEIYNEEIRDLLNKDQSVRLEVKERPDIGVYVPDISGYVVNNAVDMERIMKMGNKNRAIGATAMNASSSRSHAIFTITIENSTIGEDGKEHIKMGKLHLVDLAGSERQCKTGASGVRLKEATKINLSLSTLGNVISALVDGKSTHIPYRNSKLTRLLQDSLGGNSKTVMCANIGPADYNYDETISTLRYASRAKHVQNRAKVNEDPKDALLRQFQLEIEELRKQLEDVGQPSNDIESDSDSGDSKVTNGEISKLQKSRLPSNNSENADNVSETSSITEEQVKKENECEEKHDADFKDSQNEHKELLEKLKNLEKKILVGGENLLEKAELQEQLLEASQRELEQRKKKEEELREALEAKEAELIDIEERYSSLQEEAAGKTKKLKKVVGMFLAAKAELSDLQQEQQREMEGLLDSIRSLTRELKLQETIINSFIPKQYQEMLDQYVHWNEDIGEWQLKCVAYTGNNMRKQMADHSSGQNKEYQAPDLSHVYLSYNSDKVTNPVRPRLRSGIAETARQRYPTNYRTKSCI